MVSPSQRRARRHIWLTTDHANWASFEDDPAIKPLRDRLREAFGEQEAMSVIERLNGSIRGHLQRSHPASSRFELRTGQVARPQRVSALVCRINLFVSRGRDGFNLLRSQNLRSRQNYLG